MYALFGSCKDITIGPTAIMSLMIHSAVVDLNVEFAILGTFLSGVVIFMFGILNLGKYHLSYFGYLHSIFPLQVINLTYCDK